MELRNCSRKYVDTAVIISTISLEPAVEPAVEHRTSRQHTIGLSTERVVVLVSVFLRLSRDVQIAPATAVCCWCFHYGLCCSVLIPDSTPSLPSSLPFNDHNDENTQRLSTPLISPSVHGFNFSTVFIFSPPKRNPFMYNSSTCLPPLFFFGKVRGGRPGEQGPGLLLGVLHGPVVRDAGARAADSVPGHRQLLVPAHVLVSLRVRTNQL